MWNSQASSLSDFNGIEGHKDELMEQSRLKWQCRRGMRELDLLLTRYLEDQFSGAGESEKAAFRRLLGLSDPQLNSYLLGSETPTDKEIANVVARLRDTTPT